jgi:hypothetical protein
VLVSELRHSWQIRDVRRVLSDLVDYYSFSAEHHPSNRGSVL